MSNKAVAIDQARSELLLRLDAFLSAQFPQAQRLPHLVVAYSGGLDSSVLLHALQALRAIRNFQLSAIHVHHGLSRHADDWAAHCVRVCEAWHVPLQVVRVQVNPDGRGLEAAARVARYAAYAALQADAILLAHHQDDQAETVVLQAMRGGSLRGLSAMPATRRSEAGAPLLRPWLGVRRAELLNYARVSKLDWIEDDSNANESFRRNAVRRRVMPELQAVFPDVTGVLCRGAAYFAESADLLDALAEIDLTSAGADTHVPLAAWRALPEPRARNALRLFLERHGARVRRAALIEAVRQLRQAGEHAQCRVDLDLHALVTHQASIHVVFKTWFDVPVQQEVEWRGEASMSWPMGGGVTFQQAHGQGVRLPLDGSARLGLRVSGERMSRRPDGLFRPMKDWLREAGVPYWQRPWLPVLRVGGQVAWVAGLGAAAPFLAQAEEPGWVISWPGLP